MGETIHDGELGLQGGDVGADRQKASGEWVEGKEMTSPVLFQSFDSWAGVEAAIEAQYAIDSGLLHHRRVLQSHEAWSLCRRWETHTEKHWR